MFIVRYTTQCETMTNILQAIQFSILWLLFQEYDFVADKEHSNVRYTYSFLLHQKYSEKHVSYQTSSAEGP